MRINERIRPTWSAAACAVALTALTIGTALAAVPNTTAYQFSSHPMISGTVVTVNDHQMVVDTDQGEQVTLELDSHTMAPRDLAPGMVMRADFLALEDCHLYAQRVVPIRSGMPTNRSQAYANTRDSRETIARNASGSGGYRESGENLAGAKARESVPQTMGDHSPGKMMKATPATADYQFSIRPMISGSVLSVNDHRLVVETDQGQQVGMAMDSRTMVPGDVAPGSAIRVEFIQMEDGRYYAQRVSRIASGVADREQAYAHTRDGNVLLARNTPDCGYVSAATRNTSAVERRETVVTPIAVVASAPVPVDPPATLPQTASNQPLLLLLGLLALGSAAAITVVRGHWNA